MDDVNATPNDASRQNDGLDDYTPVQHVARVTYAGSKTSEDDGVRNRQGRENSLPESRWGREVVGGCGWPEERGGFLACSLDMGQEINGTSNTDANSVNQAAQRPTSIMSCSTRECTPLLTSNRCEILP